MTDFCHFRTRNLFCGRPWKDFKSRLNVTVTVTRFPSKCYLRLPRPRPKPGCPFELFSGFRFIFFISWAMSNAAWSYFKGAVENWLESELTKPAIQDIYHEVIKLEVLDNLDRVLYTKKLIFTLDKLPLNLYFVVTCISKRHR